MNVRNTMLSQLRGRREGFSLPRPFYVDQDYYAVDLETLFYKDWVFAYVPRRGVTVPATPASGTPPTTPPRTPNPPRRSPL